MKYLKTGLLLFLVNCIFILSSQAQDTVQYVVAGRANSAIQQTKPYVIMISADGFRYDLADKYNARFLKQIRAEGVQAPSMQPSFPSLTFPNHYTIATGLRPAHHGIVANTFYRNNGTQRYALRDRSAVTDPSWYGGIPIWVLAEKQQMLSASFYWVGSEAPIDGTYPTYYYHYNEQIPIDRRIEIVKEWLQLPEDKRPHMITFYMPEVDHQEHSYGVDNDSVKAAVHFVDEAVRKLTEMTDALGLPVNYIFLSDHGMSNVDTQHPFRRPKSLDSSKFNVAIGASMVQLYAKNLSKKEIKKAYRALKNEAGDSYAVYLKKKTPRRWHYAARDDRYGRIGDILMVAPAGKAFNFSTRKSAPGEHGYDNEAQDMQATFYAWGPAFKERLTIPPFANIHVYPLVAKILGLELLEPVDGKLNVLEHILK
ncbi:MAG: ectonucleotide pyrophosphatase/phosphodiesterase [Chitinophagaceae bacterium]|nr:ectonucleotide pyrophosphatase/phosphodiesterase [Chitinophagaceae bacterium]